MIRLCHSIKILLKMEVSLFAKTIRITSGKIRKTTVSPSLRFKTMAIRHSEPSMVEITMDRPALITSSVRSSSQCHHVVLETIPFMIGSSRPIKMN